MEWKKVLNYFVNTTKKLTLINVLNVKKSYAHKHYINNKKEIIQKVSIYQSNNPEKRKRHRHNFYVNNKSKILQRNREVYKNNKLAYIIRKRIRGAIKSQKGIKKQIN